MARILVAGLGYVGLPLAEALVQEGHQVFGLKRKPYQSSSIQVLCFDATNSESLVLPEVDEVVFCMAPKSRDLEIYKSCYVDATKNIIAALPGKTPAMYFVSSTAVYSQDQGEWVDESMADSPEPNNRSGILRAAEEHVLAATDDSYALRFGGIYGPGRTRLIQKLANGDVPLSAKPYYTNRIHRDDCVAAIQHLQHERPASGTYNAVDDDPADRNDMIRWAQSELGSPVQEKTENQGQMNKRVSNKKLKASGFKFQYSSFKDAYKEILEGLD